LSGTARVGITSISGRGAGRYIRSIHGLGYFFGALRRVGLIAGELVMQLRTFLRSRARVDIARQAFRWCSNVSICFS
jgi:hypothetical protein